MRRRPRRRRVRRERRAYQSASCSCARTAPVRTVCDESQVISRRAAAPGEKEARNVSSQPIVSPCFGAVTRGAVLASSSCERTTSISQLGSQVSGLAPPLIAVLVLQASAFQVAARAVVDFLPFLLFTLPVGVWVDD